MRRLVQVAVPVESRYDVSAHGFCNQGIITMFGIKIVNLNVGSYLHMMYKRDLEIVDKDKKDL